jgi:hypothetical protein
MVRERCRASADCASFVRFLLCVPVCGGALFFGALLEPWGALGDAGTAGAALLALGRGAVFLTTLRRGANVAGSGSAGLCTGSVFGVSGKSATRAGWWLGVGAVALGAVEGGEGNAECTIRMITSSLRCIIAISVSSMAVWARTKSAVAASMITVNWTGWRHICAAWMSRTQSK